MVVEAISAAKGGANADAPVHIEHKSVEEANGMWAGSSFSDLDAPYLLLNDELQLSGREWRSSSLERVAELLSGAYMKR